MIVNWNDCYHIIGGAITAVLLIWIMRKDFEKPFIGLIAFLSGLAINGLWEVLADGLHILPFHAVKPDIADVLRGGFGSLIIVMIYLIKK